MEFFQRVLILLEGNKSIKENTTGCNTIEEILEHCKVEESNFNLISIYPNPTNGFFNIDIENPNFEQASFSLHYIQGQQIIPPTQLKNDHLKLNYHCLLYTSPSPRDS